MMSQSNDQEKWITLARTSPSETVFQITFPFNQGLVDAVKAVPWDRRWDRDNLRWVVPANNVTAGQVVDFAIKHGFSITESAQKWIDSEQRIAKDPLASFVRAGQSLTIQGLGGTLRPYQKTAVAYVLAKRRVIIADEMGIGKTIEALATIQAANAYPALIICPSVVKVNWAREVKKWLPGKNLTILNGKTATKISNPSDIVIVNYDIISGWQSDLEAIQFNAIVVDEAHYIKGSKTKRTEIVKALAKGKHIRIALTGTPVVNRPADLITQLEALDLLKEFGGFWPYVIRYCAAHKKNGYWDMSGASYLDELHQRLIQVGYIRRTKTEVLADLAPLQRSIISVDVTSNRKLYEAVQEELLALLQKRLDARELSAAASESNTWENDEGLPKKSKIASNRTEMRILANLARLRREAALMKMPLLIEWAEDFLETGQKLVIFAHHHDVIDTLVEKLGSRWQTSCLTGKTAPDGRQRLIDQFQTNPQVQVLVANIRAVGVGVSLTACSTVAFAELDWTSAAHDQAEARCHRSGQTTRVNAYYFLAENTIDEDVYELITKKRLIINQATNGLVSVGNTSVVQELIERLIKQATHPPELALSTS